MSKLISRSMEAEFTSWFIDVNGIEYIWSINHALSATLFQPVDTSGSIFNLNRRLPIVLMLNEDDIEGSINRYEKLLLLK